jgi:glycerol-3-phosphate dehydrogenase
MLTKAQGQRSLYALGHKLNLTSRTISLLYSMYGKRTEEVFALVEQRPELAHRIDAAHPYIQAQIVYAVQSESACTIDDVLSRRIRLTITDRVAAIDSAELTSRLMAQELGWTDLRRRGQKDWFVTRYKRG